MLNWVLGLLKIFVFGGKRLELWSFFFLLNWVLGLLKIVIFGGKDCNFGVLLRICFVGVVKFVFLGGKG